jgi:hypothetical protein
MKKDALLTRQPFLKTNLWSLILMARLHQPIGTTTATQTSTYGVGSTEIFLTSNTCHVMKAFYQIWWK